MSINKFEQKIMSQNGEDGIIEEIFNRIGETDRMFVEFGVENGLECNTAYLARYKGWSGMMIEGSDSKYEQLRKNYLNYILVGTQKYFISAENIAQIFHDHGVPKELDLLSIDVDGNDYWIWKALSDYKPRVVIIEYNAYYLPPTRWVMKYNPTHSWDGTTYFGASLSSLCILGEELGYSLIGTDSKGVNAFFLRDDLLDKSGFSKLTAEEAYHPARYYGHMNKGKLGHPFSAGEFLKI